jgi:transcription initiation factor IIE alpha subunit
MDFPDRSGQYKHGSWKRVVWYLILLIVILVLMWKMPEITRHLPF